MSGAWARAARLLVFAYDRGSLPYDLLCLAMLLFLLLCSPDWLHDPLATSR